MRFPSITHKKLYISFHVRYAIRFSSSSFACARILFEVAFLPECAEKAAIRVHFLFCPFPLLAAVFPHVASPPLNYEITETEQLNPIAYMVFRNNEAGLSIDACCSFFYSTFVSVAVMYYSPLLLPINFCSFYVFSHGIFIRVSFSSHISAHFYYTLCTHTHTHINTIARISYCFTLPVLAV